MVVVSGTEVCLCFAADASSGRTFRYLCGVCLCYEGMCQRTGYSFQKPAKKLVLLSNSDAFMIFGINFAWFWKKASIFLFYIGNVPLLIIFLLKLCLKSFFQKIVNMPEKL